MKKMLFAASVVGVAVAGIILYIQKKTTGNSNAVTNPRNDGTVKTGARPPQHAMG